MPSSSPFSEEEKKLLQKMKERPQRFTPEDPTFDAILGEIATGKSFGFFEIASVGP